MSSDLDYKTIKPSPDLSDFVESFWMLTNHSKEKKEVVIVPDGRFDIFFSKSATEPYHVTLSGLATEPSQSSLAPKSTIFAISFNLLGAEYLLHNSIASQLNSVNELPANFWEMSIRDLNDFDEFCKKASLKLKALMSTDIDKRKVKLSQMIYSSQGDARVNEISEEIGWSSRQINRYFTEWFGISLKTYCTILRYRASFPQIKEGKLYPEGHFTDQAHFIREVKKFSGVTPKELTRNKNDRFIQFSTMPKK